MGDGTKNNACIFVFSSFCGLQQLSAFLSCKKGSSPITTIFFLIEDSFFFLMLFMTSICSSTSFFFAFFAKTCIFFDYITLTLNFGLNEMTNKNRCIYVTREFFFKFRLIVIKCMSFFTRVSAIIFS